jgi:hypothetical protein
VLQPLYACFRTCPLSHTLRPTFSQLHATRASRATFDFPQNSFVWENKKIDSRPHNRDTKWHAFRDEPIPRRTACPTRGQPPTLHTPTYPVPTLHLPCTYPALTLYLRSRVGDAAACPAPTLCLPYTQEAPDASKPENQPEMHSNSFHFHIPCSKC